MKYESNIDKAVDNIRLAKQRTLTAIGQNVVSGATLLSPVDTGNLRQSLTYKVMLNEVQIGTNVEYAPYIELGTVKMNAQPFLEPAVSQSKIENIVRRYFKEVDNA